MQTVKFLKDLALFIAGLTDGWVIWKMYFYYIARRRILHSPTSTEVEQIGARCALRNEIEWFFLFGSLTVLSIFSVRIPVVKQVWDAIGLRQQQYWVCAIIQRMFMSVIYMNRSIFDARDLRASEKAYRQLQEQLARSESNNHDNL